MRTGMMRFFLIPEHMRSGVTRYIEEGIRGGDFQTAVFSNDFMGACLWADWINKTMLASWAEFLKYCPPQCHGSAAKVEAWYGIKENR